VVSAVLACVLPLVFSSVAILHLENEPDSKITTAEDAVWWSLSTFTTVAFTDRLPATSEGRMLGVLLALAGMGLFAVLTACFASWFIEQELLRQLTGEVAALRDEIRLLREGSEASRQAGGRL
jgi:voltage-gated potassium channel